MTLAPRKIALFGGTFDPPHLGHLALAGQAVESIGLDRVIFIPCRQSPHKSDSSTATPDQRCEMLRLCLADKGWARISRLELERPEPSFSWQTAQFFSEEYPGADLFWILGQDQWKVIETWDRPELLRELVTFVVFPRNSETPQPREGYRVRILDLTHPAAATRIRSRLEAGEDVTSLLHPAVAAYLAANPIYRAF